MAQRRGQGQNTKLRKADSVPGDDFDFLASQQSTGSDDQALQLAVAQQLMASKEKKRKEMEKKFFVAAKAKLTNEISQAADDVKNTIEATEAIYSKFVLDYAACEDTIRALWMEIKTEEEKLLEIAKKQRAANASMLKVTEKSQIAGMAQVKEACFEMRDIMGALAS
ncbi:hypothetical protein C8R43DRAFT_1031185 [Mycena crocata]|nr:hypothetical protein C8R43DRAFT_1031185 [Mycena crocata]